MYEAFKMWCNKTKELRVGFPSPFPNIVQFACILLDQNKVTPSINHGSPLRWHIKVLVTHFFHSFFSFFLLYSFSFCNVHIGLGSPDESTPETLQFPSYLTTKMSVHFFLHLFSYVVWVLAPEYLDWFGWLPAWLICWLFGLVWFHLLSSFVVFVLLCLCFLKHSLM